MPGKFFTSYLRSPIFVRYVESVQTGIAYPAINDKQFFGAVIAIPPLAEQHRIVAKVDELMIICDQLEQQQNESNAAHQTLIETLLTTLTTAGNQGEFAEAWERIGEHFDTLFITEYNIDQLKQTILQLAVMGKLISQDPNDEPASVLLEKIAEKAQLIKDGKIKKQVPLSEINDDEKLFDLPEGWEWVRLGNYGRVLSGNSFKSDNFNAKDGVRVIKITNAGVGEFIETEDYLPTNFLKEYESFIVRENDLILALTRPYISNGLKISKCPASYHNSLLNQRVVAMRFNINEDYVFLFLRSLFVLNLYKDRFGGTGLQPNLKVADVTNLILPIPPIEEQYRIISKVDELMAICDTLKARLKDAQTTQVQLADAIVDQAVG
jgi:type I restriction enzyme, S subunit